MQKDFAGAEQGDIPVVTVIRPLRKDKQMSAGAFRTPVPTMFIQPALPESCRVNDSLRSLLDQTPANERDIICEHSSEQTPWVFAS